MIKIDFHTHSTSSDGLMSPKEVVERAYQNGVKYLALTDHDTVSGLHNAIQTAKEINLPLMTIFFKSITFNRNHNHPT